ncbi:hypothetical protein MAP00_008493 [Monascus purpureus]|nr:hypothetical protein MAP00_008493 [Monascus purpureus]
MNQAFLMMLQRMQAMDERQQLMQEQVLELLRQQQNAAPPQDAGTHRDNATTDLYNSLQLEIKQLTK